MFKRLKEQWLYDTRYIDIKKKIRIALRKVFKLKMWHDDPLNAKPYAAYVVKTVNRYLSEYEISTVVEIGCGLGDVIGNIELKKNKYGYDIDNETIKCASLLHPKTMFSVGSFNDVKIGKIDLLIIVNVLHRISDEELIKWFGVLKDNNDIKMICLDTQLRETDDYPHIHDYKKILGEEYTLKLRSKGFSAIGNNRRYIEFYEKDGCAHE